MTSKQETNWDRYFGSQEKTANTLVFITRKCYYSLTEECGECPIKEPCMGTEKDFEKWLKTPIKKTNDGNA